MQVLGTIFQWISLLVGVLLVVVVALQTSKSEGLSGILAGGGGGGGKVGREKHLDNLSWYLAFGWLILTALSAWLRHAGG